MDGPRVLEPLWTMGGGSRGRDLDLSLYDQVGSPSPSGWFGRKVRFLEVGGGWPGPGGSKRRSRGPGWEQMRRSPAQGNSFGLGPGSWWGVFLSARHGGWRPPGGSGGWAGRGLCLGLVTLEHLTLPPSPPTQDGHPGVGVGMGLGRRGGGHPVSPA